MYGLLIQSCVDYIKARYGEDIWLMVQTKAGITHTVFNTHTGYSESLMVEIAQTTSNITGDKEEDIMDAFGVQFVSFVGQYGYDRILKVLGRNMRDFLNGLDNLHEYLRFSYPNLKPPSFFVEDETKSGLTLTYRSRRKGYLNYVQGQIRQVGKQFYNTTVNIFVVADDYDEKTKTTHVKYRLMFDNKAFKEIQNRIMDNVVESIPLQPELLFELFPFHIVFSRKMEIRSMGQGLRAVLPSAIGNSIIDFFLMERPLAKFTWGDILRHTNNVFQLSTKERVLRVFDTVTMAKNAVNPDNKGPSRKASESDAEYKSKTVYVNSDEQENSETDVNRDEEENSENDAKPETMVEPLCLSFKGQMIYINEWDCIMFLGTPIMSSLDDMFRAGLYINDLSMHDSSRDLVLAGTQQSAELKLALDQEQEKSRLLEHSMLKLDHEMQRTDALLYQMIPRPVAERLRRGEPSVDTCQVFESVTILFSDVVGFTVICSKITPMEVVSMLNAMYTKFDQLSENHSVYKVETIGDAYMAVSGAPTITKYHAQHMSEMAMDMIASMYDLRDPSSDEHMKLRIGIHTGNTVAGVVGIKMPRYCLFGDTVNTASRMESGGEAMRIHISETTKQKLEGFPYQVEERGSILVKGKGQMKTYWLVGHKEVDDTDVPKCPFMTILKEEVKEQNNNQKPTSTFTDTDSDLNLKRATSPLAYSPVSFKDVDDAHPFQFPHGSRNNSRNNSIPGLDNSPYRQRSNTISCPFSYKAIPNSQSHSLPNPTVPCPNDKAGTISNRFHNTDSARKGNYICSSSSPSESNIPAKSIDVQKPTGHNNRYSPISHTDIADSSATTRYDKPSVPESIDSGISVAVANTNSNSSSISRNHKISPEIHSSCRTPTKTARIGNNLSTSSSRFRSQVTDGIARIAPMVTTTPSRMKVGPEVIDDVGDLTSEADNRAPSVKSTHSRKSNVTPSSLNNFQEFDSAMTNHHMSSIGNGSVGESESESTKQSKETAGVFTGKMDESSLSTPHIVGSSKVGCFVRDTTDKEKMDRKSKTCYIL